MQLDEGSPTPALRQVRGSAKIADALRHVSFPITKGDLIARLHGATIDFGDTKAPLAEIVRGVPRARFRDADQARRDVNERWLRISKALEAVDDAERAGR